MQKKSGLGFRLVSPRDGDGHGDTFSAFAIALVLAKEVAGKQPIILGSMMADGPNYQEQFAQRLREYAEEQTEVENDPDPTGYLNALTTGNASIIGYTPLFSRSRSHNELRRAVSAVRVRHGEHISTPQGTLSKMER